MTAFALIVTHSVKPGRESDFDRLVSAVVTAIGEREPGTLAYICHSVPGEPGQRILYELYTDRDAFVDHENQAHTKAFLAEREPLIDRISVTEVSPLDPCVVRPIGP
jgi:quinol monooxygenase YgiN